MGLKRFLSFYWNFRAPTKLLLIFHSIPALAEEEKKKLDEKEALEEQKREEAERRSLRGS